MTLGAGLRRYFHWEAFGGTGPGVFRSDVFNESSFIRQRERERLFMFVLVLRRVLVAVFPRRTHEHLVPTWGGRPEHRCGSICWTGFISDPERRTKT